MKITSDDGKAVIELVRNDDTDPDFGHRIGLTVSTIAGNYTGANGCVYFSDFQRFVSSFSEFVRSRQGEVLLDMTEDCRLEFFRWNQKGDVGVRATISQWQGAGGDPARSTPLKVTGTFKIDSEALNSLDREFHDIQRNGEPGGTDRRPGPSLNVR